MKKFLSVLTTGANQHPCCLLLAGTSLCRRCLFSPEILSAPNSLFHAFSFAPRHIYTSFYQLFKKRSVKNRLPQFCDSLLVFLILCTCYASSAAISLSYFSKIICCIFRFFAATSKTFQWRFAHKYYRN